LGLSSEDIAEILPSSGQTRFANRVAWAHNGPRTVTDWRRRAPGPRRLIHCSILTAHTNGVVVRSGTCGAQFVYPAELRSWVAVIRRSPFCSANPDRVR
jgi:hypothetical protein